ncbi:CopG family transcriptional regulator [Xenophilus arseniciresistens]|uniref:CopG family transcriptional regulator n=1 Tax=Xenophilus arseniciresistens TaxID=1283306 RepID=A0AAE3SYH7_9BURK|nr:CopG family transcriptional regulator [Xenophilus arseniciresistens]MDA7415505.1 CopG family transcriptional regulator [Xenophilus arseniciresistens]
MKNVTITVDEGVLEWARVEAARRGSSVSRMVGEMLADKMRHDDAYERAYREWQFDDRRWMSDGQAPFARDEIYAERLARFR